MSTNYQSNKGKIGLLTSFDPKYSKLSKHSSQLLNCLDINQVVVLADEQSKFRPKQFKHNNVINCWSSKQNDFSELFKVLNKEQIKLLYLNCFQPFFSAENFIPFINLCHLQGIEVIAEINNSSLLDANLTEIVERLNSVIINDALIFPQCTQADNPENTENWIKPNSIKPRGTRLPRILMQSRPNAYSQPGGDTVVMDRVSEGLRARGITVDIDLKNEKNVKDYDLVNLFNFAIKDHTESLAKNCKAQGTPYVVTTLYEDWPLFFNQMQAHYVALDGYIKSNQSRSTWQELTARAKMVKPTPIWDNSFAANNAAALLSTGEYESFCLKRDYPNVKRIETFHCGGEISDLQDNGELFYQQTGLKDFILCVGRFELRKNQLMLLKALEDSDLTLVFAGGGFSYQPEYLEACKKFKRKGKTVFLDRLEAKMLNSAFQAAKIHALPSWFELPGIVSLEAARLGRNVVATTNGTSRDYLANYAFYCTPDQPETIYNAIMAAYYAPVNPELQKRVENYTWDAAAVRNGEIYQLALGEREDLDWSFLAESRTTPISNTERIEKNLENLGNNTQAAMYKVKQIPLALSQAQAPISNVSITINENLEDQIKEIELLKKKKKHDLALSKTESLLSASRSLNKDELDKLLIIKAEIIACKGELEKAKIIFNSIKSPQFNARVLAGKGVIAAAESNWDTAITFFIEANQDTPQNDVPLAGLALCFANQGKIEKAWEFYQKALSLNPENLTAILGIIELAYKLNRVSVLEVVLQKYLNLYPHDENIIYSLAGAFYSQGKFKEALEQIEKILATQPKHELGLELKAKIQENPLKMVGSK